MEKGKFIKQKLTKTITDNYTTTDADCGYRIICNSSNPITITLHTVTNRFNFDLEINNIGAGDVTCSGQTISQYSHAHVGNNNGTAWIVSIGGGGGDDIIDDSTPASDKVYSSTKVEDLISEFPVINDITPALNKVYSSTKTQELLDSLSLAFTDLSDVPSSYTDQAGKIPVVKQTEDGLEFVAVPAAENGIPAGGTTNQILAKNSNNDYDGKWLDAPEAANGIPSGGTTGQVLSKASDDNYDVTWADGGDDNGKDNPYVNDTEDPNAVEKDTWIDTDDYSRVDRKVISSNTTLLISDNEYVEISGTTTVTLFAATEVTTGVLFSYLKNVSTDLVTVNVVSSGTIDGDSAVYIYPKECRILAANGTEWKVIA